MKKAVVLLSGGLDSTTSLYWAKNQGYTCVCLIFDYRQRHRKEVNCAVKIAGLTGCEYQIIKFQLPWLGSALLDKRMPIPDSPLEKVQGSGFRVQGSGSREQEAEDNGQGLGVRGQISENSPLEKGVRGLSSTLEKGVNHSPLIRGVRGVFLSEIPSTYVPARNTIFLSFALSYAEVIGAQTVIIGANALDYSGYPDCRPEYYEVFRRLSAIGTKQGTEGKPIEILTPLIDKTKAEIVKLGVKLNVPFELTWSCYKGGKKPCGKCDSCLLRSKGFEQGLG